MGAEHYVKHLQYSTFWIRHWYTYGVSHMGVTRRPLFINSYSRKKKTAECNPEYRDFPYISGRLTSAGFRFQRNLFYLGAEPLCQNRRPIFQGCFLSFSSKNRCHVVNECNLVDEFTWFCKLFAWFLHWSSFCQVSRFFLYDVITLILLFWFWRLFHNLREGKRQRKAQNSSQSSHDR